MQPLPLIDSDTGRNAVARISAKHDMIMNWLLENPHRLLRDCAREFNISQTWLSQLIHSDIFQAELKRRQGEVFLAIANDIPAKLKGLADVAIEKVTRMVEESEDPDLVMDAFDKTLHRLGYAPQRAASAAPAAPVQVNTFVVSQADLAAARQAIAAPQQKQLEATIELHSQGGSFGGAVEIPASVSQAD